MASIFRVPDCPTSDIKEFCQSTASVTVSFSMVRTTSLHRPRWRRRRRRRRRRYCSRNLVTSATHDVVGRHLQPVRTDESYSLPVGAHQIHTGGQQLLAPYKYYMLVGWRPATRATLREPPGTNCCPIIDDPALLPVKPSSTALCVCRWSWALTPSHLVLYCRLAKIAWLTDNNYHRVKQTRGRP